MVKVNWIYYLKMEDLLTYATEFGLNNSGTVDELRKEFPQFVNQNPSYETRFAGLETKHSKTTLTTNQEGQGNSGTASGSRPATPVNNIESVSIPTIPNMSYQFAGQLTQPPSTVCVMDRARKWGIKYDGKGDPLSFVERVEEMAEGYEVDINSVPRALPELFKDRALVWLRNNNRHWSEWNSFKYDFLRFFLSASYFEREIRQRTQRPRESFKDYVLELQNLMKHANLTEEQRLQRIYRNCRSEYQLYIKRTEFQTIEGLVSLAEDFKNITNGREAQRVVPRALPARRSDVRHFFIQELPDVEHSSKNGNGNTQRSNPPTRQTYTNPRAACRRCGENGHRAYACRNERRDFCWECGRFDILTKNCCRASSGNNRRLDQTRGVGSPAVQIREV
ncbi:uncharacterized protein [Eurosta solidaginis]|uniref:uncharacterized protein n=1 Tax=Eurosta solidaginis TaxID=178769 RepID=UPI0035310C81